MGEMEKADDKRRTVRIPTEEVERILLEEEESIDIQVGPSPDALKLNGKLLDIHENGMCFMMLNHALREGDLIFIDALLGKFHFTTDAMVRWTLGSQVGVEFLDSSARDAAFLAELYTARILQGLLEDDEDGQEDFRDEED